MRLAVIIAVLAACNYPTPADVAFPPGQEPEAPVSAADAVRTAEDTPLEIDVAALLANDTDANPGDSLTVTSVGSAEHGSVTLAGSTITFVPEPDFPHSTSDGVATFQYSISDGTFEATGTVAVTVTPVNDAPVAADDTKTTLEDTVAMIPASALLANDIDADGDMLSIIAVQSPQHCMAMLVGNSIQLTPDVNYNGDATFTYAVSDGHSITNANVLVTVQSVNDPPIVADDSKSTPEDTAVAIDVLANDSDLDGGTLAIDTVTQPANGSVTFAGGTVTYTPAANFNGLDTFSYTATDGQSGFSTTDVSITVQPVNDAPVAVADAKTTPEDTPGSFDVLANDADVDGDSITVVGHTSTTHGSLSITSAGAAVYTPVANYHGPDSFQYTISDGNVTNTATVTITVSSVNDAPVATDDSLGTFQDTSASVNVLANDSDIDGDTLVVGAFAQPAHGTVSFAGGTATYVPTTGYNGPDSFQYTASDGNGGTDTATVDIFVSGCGGPCLLTAVRPAIANAGDTITLEGTFATTAVVNFPGGVARDAVILGQHRATVVVPATATAGALTVTTANATVGPVPFRRASYPLGLQTFTQRYEQSAHARQESTLTIGRDSHTVSVVGNFVYAIGGELNTSPSVTLDTVERAAINADGTLGAFALVPGVTLTKPRQNHGAIVVGRFLYVIGGTNNSGTQSDLERAVINPDGSIGNFIAVPNTTLTTPRRAFTTAVIGNFLYLIAGNNNVATNTVERAVINADSTLGAFAQVTGVTLRTARGFHTSEVIGNAVFVMGGTSGATSLDSVERAPINADGTIGNFATLANQLFAARAAHTSAVVGPFVYLLGGFGAGTLSSIERAPINPDGSLGTSVVVANLTTGRDASAATLAGGYLYVIGGNQQTSIERASIDASGAIGTFATVPTTLDVPRGSQASVTTVRGMILLGGRRGQNDVDRLASLTDLPVNPDGTFAPATAAGSMVGARLNPVIATTGAFVYAIGGSSNVVLDSVERAPINFDGTLGPFTMLPVTLTVPRAAATGYVSGNSLFVIGGVNSSSYLDSVERATINSDGTLGAFAVVSGVTMTAKRACHTSAVIGNFLYVISGNNATQGDLKSVERAPINADGSLGAFANAGTLLSARNCASNAVIGNTLYVMGGGGVQNNAERATITNGSLGTFSNVAAVTMDTGRQAFTAAVIGNALVVVGGIGQVGESLSSIEQSPLQ